MIQVGGLYRIRYTGKPLNLPIAMEATTTGLHLTFSESIDKKSGVNVENFEINTWDLKRTRKYGSDRYNVQKLNIDNIQVSLDGRDLSIFIPEIKPTWVMEVIYRLKSQDGVEFSGAIQNTIHELAVSSEQLTVNSEQ